MAKVAEEIARVFHHLQSFIFHSLFVIYLILIFIGKHLNKKEMNPLISFTDVYFMLSYKLSLTPLSHPACFMSVMNNCRHYHQRS